MNDWDEMLTELGAIPELPGARCRGRHELFDATFNAPQAGGDYADLEYAREAAIRLCDGCPSRAPCAAWRDSLPPAKRPLGIVAGKLRPAKENLKK